MCTVISGGCGCNARSSSTGASAALAIVAGLSAVALAGAAWRAAPWLWAVSLVAGWVAVYRRPRRAVLTALAGLVLLTRWAIRRRREARPTRAVVVARQWQVTLYTTVGGRNRVLGVAPATGLWTSPAEVEGEAMRRYVAVHGYPVAGTLCCRAEPVA